MTLSAGYIEELQRIAPAECFSCHTKLGHTDECRFNKHPAWSLVISQPLRPDMEGWGQIGNRIISYAVVAVWRINGFLELAQIDPGNCWVLTEKGQRASDWQLKEDQWIMPKTNYIPNENSPDERSDVPVEGLLFTRAGTCTLCGKKMDVFGQISHAKSHIGKGHPVFIEEVHGKKVARVTEGAEMSPPPVQVTADPGEFLGQELFSALDEAARSRCRLCPGGPPVHKFGQISHAKSHIANGDPVELRMIQKKNVPLLMGIIEESVAPPPPPVAPPRVAVDTSTLTPAQAEEREKGINAILTLQRIAGLPEIRAEAEINWDNMGPVTKFQTVRTAAKLEKI